jgi:hypothetical protein
MTTVPILTAEQLLIDALKAALTPYVGTYDGRPKAYYLQAEQDAPLPFLIFQFQSDIGRLDWIDNTGAEVLVTLKALAANGSTARTLLNDAAPALENLSAPGFTITARYERTPGTLLTNGIYQALHVYRVRVERA